MLAGYRDEEIEQAKAELDAAESELEYQQQLLGVCKLDCVNAHILKSTKKEKYYEQFRYRNTQKHGD